MGDTFQLWGSVWHREEFNKTSSSKLYNNAWMPSNPADNEVNDYFPWCLMGLIRGRNFIRRIVLTVDITPKGEFSWDTFYCFDAHGFYLGILLPLYTYMLFKGPEMGFYYEMFNGSPRGLRNCNWYYFKGIRRASSLWRKVKKFNCVSKAQFHG